MCRLSSFDESHISGKELRSLSGCNWNSSLASTPDTEILCTTREYGVHRISGLIQRHTQVATRDQHYQGFAYSKS
jgi:hypothetical protein